MIDVETSSASRDAGAPARLGRLLIYLTRHRAVVLAAIVLIAGVTRIVTWRQLSHSPGLSYHRAATTDMAFFHEWALACSRGDWLSRRVRPPVHGWHQEIVAAYRAGRHSPRGGLSSGVSLVGGDAEVAAAVWRRWRGADVFYQDPLYPYLLGILYRLFGADVRSMILLQLVVGVATSLLVWWVTWRCFGDLAAAIAAVLFLGYAPALFYETVLLRTTFLSFAGLVSVFLLQRALDRRSLWGALLAGVGVGGAVLLKGTFLLLAVFFVGFALVDAARPRWRWQLAGSYAAGFALPLLLLALRNLAVGVPPLALASGGAETFAHSNSPSYAPHLGTAYSATEVANILGHSEGRFPATVVATVQSHSSLRSWLGLLAAKAAVALHWYELPNNVNFYYGEHYLPMLTVLPVRFTLVAALGLVGLVLAVRSRAVWPLSALCAVHAVSLILFYVLSRYRLPLAVALIPFAAHTVTTIMVGLSEARWRRSAALVVAVLVLGGVIGRGLPAGSPPIRNADRLLPIYTYWMPRAVAALESGRAAEAASILADALRFEPADIRSLGRSGLAASEQERQLAVRFADLHLAYAEALAAAGQPSEALAERQRAAELRSLVAP